MVCLCVLAWGCTAEYRKFVLYVYVSCKCIYIISIDIYACLYNNVIYIYIHLYLKTDPWELFHIQCIFIMYLLDFYSPPKISSIEMLYVSLVTNMFISLIIVNYLYQLIFKEYCFDVIWIANPNMYLIRLY